MGRNGHCSFESSTNILVPNLKLKMEKMNVYSVIYEIFIVERLMMHLYLGSHNLPHRPIGLALVVTALG